MSVYVDDAFIGVRWCHMMADDDAELEEMARKLRLKSDWRHGDHYDLANRQRVSAIKYGATEVAPLLLVNLRRQRKGQPLLEEFVE